MKRKWIVIFISLAMFGCAAGYKPISPTNLNYRTNSLNEGVHFSYKYDVLAEKGNKKYARKEISNNLKLVAVKISNYTDKSLVVGQDINFYSGYNLLVPVDPNIIKKEIKQSSASYLLYLLLTPLKLYVSTTNENGVSVETYPIGYGLGPGLSLINMAISAGSNQKFADEINNYSLIGTEIKKGETVYGLVGFRDLGYDHIKIKIE